MYNQRDRKEIAKTISSKNDEQIFGKPYRWSYKEKTWPSGQNSNLKGISYMWKTFFLYKNNFFKSQLKIQNSQFTTGMNENTLSTLS